MDIHSTHDALMKAAILLDDSDNRFLRGFGLNRTQYIALQLLDQQQGQRLVDLATALLCERSTITRIIDRLEQDGLVQRQADAEDRRSQRVILTAAGVNLQEKTKMLFEASLQQRLNVLSDEEQRQLVGLLKKLQTGLSADLMVQESEA